MMMIKKIAPWMATAAIVTVIGFAPVAATAAAASAPVVSTTQPAPVGSAGTDPLVPFGADPAIPYRLGFIDPNHDNANTTNGEVDLPS
jgi:hypothetical protein